MFSKLLKENVDINIKKRTNMYKVAFPLGWGGGKSGLSHKKSMSSTLHNKKKHPNV